MENMDKHDPLNEQQPDEKAARRTLSNILLGLTILLFLSGVYMLLREYVIMPQTDYVAPPTAAPSVSLAPLTTPTATAAPTPVPTPYALLPVKVYFPTFEQVCEIQPVGLTSDGAMDTIPSNVIAAWYEYGPSPGDNGNAILNGHKSWKGELGVFSKLKEMELNDQVVIEMDDGSFLYWYVQSVDVYGRTDVPSSVMELKWGEKPQITLISCTGEWDRKAGTSSQRVVVTCVLDPVA